MRRERLVARRRELGESQSAIAHAVGVERSTYVRWERGLNHPALWNRRPLADALGVPLATLDDLLVVGPMAERDPSVEDVVAALERVMAGERGEQQRPKLRLLGHSYEALGELAFDQLRHAEATQCFQQAHEIGVEVSDPDLASHALIRLGDIARRRGRHTAGLRILDAAERDIAAASLPTRARRWKTAARVHAEMGDRAAFEVEIGRAEDAAEQAATEAPGLVRTGPRDVRLERAQGLTLLGRPEDALAIYEGEPEVFASPRERGSFLILHAQALAHAGHLDEGVRLALDGLRLARSYGSPRHASRVQRMYDRLAAAAPGGEPRLAPLGEALAGP